MFAQAPKVAHRVLAAENAKHIKISMYEDDGKTFNYRSGEFMKLQMDWTDAKRRLNLRLASGSRMLAPSRRPLEIRVAGQTATRAATFDGRPLEIRF